jgi:glycosyltransferase involved in cell wall biosynthesis
VAITASEPGEDDGQLLLVSVSDPTAPPGGREMLYRLNRAILESLFGDRLRVFRPDLQAASSAAGALRGYIDGINPGSIDQLCQAVAMQGVTRVFLDGSNFGRAAQAIKQRAPHVQVFTFFHNVEARFFWGSLKVRRSPRALAVFLANYVAERAAVRASDALICLSERDSQGLTRWYGRTGDAILPMSLADQLPSDGSALAERLRPPYALFVGGAFYANVEGLRWFAREVAPKIGIPIVVVGRGMEVLADELAATPSVELIGAVDDLASWYHGAAFAIAPIFDGSGMKTKVAEALMFGKHVIGTAEAFSGYEAQVIRSGWQCRTADEFVAAVEEAASRDLPAFDRAQRTLYERLYSLPAATARLAAVFGLAG